MFCKYLMCLFIYDYVVWLFISEMSTPHTRILHLQAGGGQGGRKKSLTARGGDMARGKLDGPGYDWGKELEGRGRGFDAKNRQMAVVSTP